MGRRNNKEMTIINAILIELYGKNKPFECKLFKNSIYQYSSYYQTHYLAYAFGENWNLLSKENSYEIAKIANL